MAVSTADAWPALPFESWRDTCANLQLRTQIVGKIRLALTPWLNHSWHVTLYPAANGLTTSAIPYEARTFRMDFDFIEHRLLIESSDGRSAALALKDQSIADFYAAVMSTLEGMDIRVRIHATPNEVANPIPFANDREHHAYDPQAVRRFWDALSRIAVVLQKFRTGFIGKASPVHFFWGSFDLAVTRFSGRTAPSHPGGVPALPDVVAKEAYSHEVSSAGFWPGGGGFEDAAFYSYAYPEPPGFRDAPLKPAAAFYHETLHEFVLPYEVVRKSPAPVQMLMDFLQTTYEAAAVQGKWDRDALECAVGQPGRPRQVP
jgi:hypothetical protein